VSTTTRPDHSSPDLLREELEQFLGRPGATPRRADDEVNAPMIRHWCQSMGDDNPAYLDPQWAGAAVHGGLVAPPTMLQVWTHHDRRFDAEHLSEEDGEEHLARRLRDAGYPSVVATEAAQEYVRYVRPGDRLVYSSQIESISDQKKTALGRGFFITVLVTYTAEPADGESAETEPEVVGRMRFVTFRFRPAAADWSKRGRLMPASSGELPTADPPMSFEPDDSQLAAREATARALAPWDAATGDRVSGWAAVWRRLVGAGLVGLARESDSSGLEPVEVLIGLGRRALHVPLLGPTALLPILASTDCPAREQWLDPVTDGSAIVTVALGEVGVDRFARTAVRARRGNDGWTVSGTLIAVPFADGSDRIAVVARATEATDADTSDLGLLLIDTNADGVELVATIGTTGEPEWTVHLDGVLVPMRDIVLAPVAASADVIALYEQRLMVGLSAEQLGLAEAALDLTAAYTTEREQFGRPIATFQAVSTRAADAFIDLTAMRWTLYLAAADLAEGRDAAWSAATAKFWSAEGGGRVMAAAVHLHGGLGVDTSYPLHRYYLRSRQLELAFGAAGGQLARLWEELQHDEG
jgi:alkylation response protein AidB-like acyl-CoA dehydrogenase